MTGPAGPGGDFCAGQPTTFTDVSEESLGGLRRMEGLRLVRVDPAEVGPEVSPERAAGPIPPAECRDRRVVSWEPALGLVTTTHPCTPQPDGTCRTGIRDRLAYVVVRRTFGLGLRPHGYRGTFEPPRDVVVNSYSVIDARSGRFLRGATGW